MSAAELALIVAGWVLAISSPGPATLSVMASAMENGRREALAMAMGVVSGSAMWALSAGLGLGALMVSHAWTIEVLRYAGAGYLAWLAFKSARAAVRPAKASGQTPRAPLGMRRAWFRGLMIHLTNPKAVLFWGALFAVVVSPEAPGKDILTVGAACLTSSVFVFTGFAMVFSLGPVRRTYLALRRWFDGAFAILFGAASLKILTARLT